MQEHTRPRERLITRKTKTGYLRNAESTDRKIEISVRLMSEVQNAEDATVFV